MSSFKAVGCHCAGSGPPAEWRQVEEVKTFLADPAAYAAANPVAASGPATGAPAEAKKEEKKDGPGVFDGSSSAESMSLRSGRGGGGRGRGDRMA